MYKKLSYLTLSVILLCTLIYEATASPRNLVRGNVERIFLVDNNPYECIILWEKPQYASHRLSDLIICPPAKLWHCYSYTKIPFSWTGKKFSVAARVTWDNHSKNIFIEEIHKIN